MFRYIVLYALFVSTLISFSQDADGVVRFNNIYDSVPMTRNIIEIDSGYICVGGITNTSNEINIQISFIDTLGNYVWGKEIGFSGYDIYHGLKKSLINTYDGGYALGGTKQNKSNEALTQLLIKFDENFDTLWIKEFYTDTIFHTTTQCLQTQDSGYVFVGYKDQSNTTQRTDIILTRTDKNGNFLWNKTYGNYYLYEECTCIAQTKDNGFIIGGWKGDKNDIYSGDLYIIRTDSIGDVVWTETYGNPDYNDSGISDIITTKDSCYIITGCKVYEYEIGYNNMRARIIKMDENRNFLWDKEYEDMGEGVGFLTPIELEDGNIVVTGTYNGVPLEAYHANTLYKLDHNGNEIWHRHLEYPLGEEVFCYMFALTQTRDGGFAMAGVAYFFDLTPTQQMRVVKVDSCGCDTMGCDCDYSNSQEYENNCEINIFPNPTTGKISIQAEGIKKIEVMDMNGRLMYTGNKVEVNLSNYQKGIFIVKVITEKGVALKKVIVK
ncbi:MAG: T9SS type A sorting domain-containing protein [Bacteroidota bacterium]